MGERKIVVIPANPEKVKLYKVGIYCRVSTSIREQLYSIAAQAVYFCLAICSERAAIQLLNRHTA